MGRRILSVGHYQGSYRFLEIDQQAGGFFAKTPPPVSTLEALLSACRKADEIYVGADFPAALYKWEKLPKVAKRFQANLVTQDARDKMGLSTPVHTQYKVLGEVVETGVSRLNVAYIGLPEEEILPLWETFEKFLRKVKFISPIPVALASMVKEIDKPDKNFIVVWVGEQSSVIVMSSPDGVVKMARQVPVGLSAQGTPEDSYEDKVWSDDLGRELLMTSTFYKQEFREAVPQVIYFLGNSRIQNIFSETPVPGVPTDVRFALSKPPASGLPEEQLNQYIHLIANLYLPQEFNFLTKEAMVGRKSDVLFRSAVAILIVVIIGTGLWGVQLYGAQKARETEVDREIAQIKDLQSKIKSIQVDLEQLRPLEGWKKFYDQTYQARPAWNMLFSEVALLLPENVMIEELQLLDPAPGTPMKAEDKPTRLKGMVRADNWDEGLRTIRQFGERLQASPLFSVIAVEYAPKNLEQATKVFNFSITVNLLSRGAK